MLLNMHPETVIHPPNKFTNQALLQLVCIVLVLTIAGCGGPPEGNNDDDSPSKMTTPPSPAQLHTEAMLERLATYADTNAILRISTTDYLTRAEFDTLIGRTGLVPSAVFVRILIQDQPPMSGRLNVAEGGVDAAVEAAAADLQARYQRLLGIELTIAPSAVSFWGFEAAGTGTMGLEVSASEAGVNEVYILVRPIDAVQSLTPPMEVTP